MSADELYTRLQHLLASEPELMDEPTLLARRVREEAGVISDVDLLELLRNLRHDTTGLGALEPLLSQPGVTDVVVNGPRAVFVDRGQGLEKSTVQFRDDAQVRRLATRLVVAAGGRLDDAAPCADGHLDRGDGTALRVHAMLSPPAVDGTCLSVRVLRQTATTFADLVDNGTVHPTAAKLLRRVVAARLSFVVIGGTGSGKTTLLSALLGQAADSERLLLIEDTTELAPAHPHVVSLAARRANAEGQGEISLTHLLRQALRMRPDRIVVGEIRGGEVVDLLAALNTGHDGGAGTLHANSLAEVPARMEALAALGGLDRVGLHSQLAAAVQVVLTMRRTAHGRRLAQIGLVRSQPIRVQAVWEYPGEEAADSGALPGCEELEALLYSRLGPGAEEAVSA